MNFIKITLLSVALVATQTCRALDLVDRSAVDIVKPTSIRSELDLARYLEQTRREVSPLNALSKGARKRFLASLQFRPGGLAGFATDDLAEALTHAQIVAVLSLFDSAEYAKGLQGRNRILAPRAFESDFERRFDAFYRSFRDEPAPSAAQVALDYQRLLGSQRARELGSRLDLFDLAMLYRATILVLQENPVPELFADARYLLGVLNARGEATAPQVAALFEKLVAARRFDQADRLVDDFPHSGLAPLPVRTFVGVPESTRNAMLHVSQDGSRLSRSTLDLDHGLELVVVAGCHFAKDAAIAISADVEWSSWFHQHATWLAPESEAIDAVAAWNQEFPQQPIQIAWRQSDWPTIPSWNMPTFYLFREGVLLTQWSGWAPDSGMETLRKKLSGAGIVPDPGKN